MTQTEMVKNYMETHGSITPNDAIYQLGITRLAARISDLRRQGTKITATTEHGQNRFGEDRTYKRYRLG